jgi:phosphate/sulfate permease
MLFLVFVLIFALPMSSTHVVMSGLTGVSLIYYTVHETNYIWFAEEFAMWVITPFISTGFTWLMYILVKKHIFNHKDARKRVVALLPWYITFCLYFMFACALSKNYRYNFDAGQKIYGASWTIPLIISLVLFPLICLPMTRCYLLTRARTMHKHAELE